MPECRCSALSLATKALAVRASVLDAAKECQEVQVVLHRLELGFRVGVVVREMRAAIALGDVQLDQQGGHRLGAHGSTPVRVQREHAALHIAARDRIGDQLLGQLRALMLHKSHIV